MPVTRAHETSRRGGASATNAPSLSERNGAVLRNSAHKPAQITTKTPPPLTETPASSSPSRFSLPPSASKLARATWPALAPRPITVTVRSGRVPQFTVSFGPSSGAAKSGPSGSPPFPHGSTWANSSRHPPPSGTRSRRRLRPSTPPGSRSRSRRVRSQNRWPRGYRAEVAATTCRHTAAFGDEAIPRVASRVTPRQQLHGQAAPAHHRSPISRAKVGHPSSTVVWMRSPTDRFFTKAAGPAIHTHPDLREMGGTHSQRAANRPRWSRQTPKIWSDALDDS